MNLFGEEQIKLINCENGEELRLTIRSEEDFRRLKEQLAEHNVELEYLSGCLTDTACDTFMELAELAIQYEEELELVGKVFNTWNSISETNLILQSGYAIIRAKSDGLAFAEFLKQTTDDLTNVPTHVQAYLDFERWLEDSSVIVVSTGAPKNDDGQDEFVVYDLG